MSRRAPIVTTELADEIVRSPKILAETVQWRANQTHRGSFRFTAQLFAPGVAEPLDLRGNKGGHSWAFSLNYLDCRLRTLDFGSKAHRCPRSGIYIPKGVIHKHRWMTEYGDREAYIPDDIDVSTIDAALITFLGEVNVELRSQILWSRELF